jgi:uncharacterized protein
MATELYDLTVPVITRALTTLASFLDKGRAWADEQGIEHSELLEGRLAPDMHPLPYQIQRVSDSAKGVLVRIGGLDNVPMEDNEVSFDELQARIAKTLDFVRAVPRDKIDGREDAEVILKAGDHELKFTARDYWLGFAIPNLYFHVTAAYLILRHKGVPVGKRDFLGG